MPLSDHLSNSIYLITQCFCNRLLHLLMPLSDLLINCILFYDSAADCIPVIISNKA